MSDRRAQTRRTRALIAEPLTRKGDRRDNERRDSPRKDVALDVREPGRKSRSCTGDLSIGGASFITTAPPVGDAVELLFTVPTFTGPIIANAIVVARSGLARGTQVSVVFIDLEVEAELAIAQWFDDDLISEGASQTVLLAPRHGVGKEGLARATDPGRRSEVPR